MSKSAKKLRDSAGGTGDPARGPSGLETDGRADDGVATIAATLRGARLEARRRGLRRVGNGRRTSHRAECGAHRYVDDAVRPAGARGGRDLAGGSGLGARQGFRRTLSESGRGFFFSTVVVDANKAGEGPDARYRSYGTATADGILALIALGDSAIELSGASGGRGGWRSTIGRTERRASWVTRTGDGLRGCDFITRRRAS